VGVLDRTRTPKAQLQKTGYPQDDEGIKNYRVQPPKALVVQEDSEGTAVLEALMQGKTTDWKLARSCAGKMRDPDYSCQDFYRDIQAAFPELRLYCLEGVETTSGRSVDDEYQRTIGALFTLYWILRLDMDGKDSFVYGLDIDKGWVPRREQHRDFLKDAKELEKRKVFMQQTNWGNISALLLDAGILLKDNNGELSHDVERTLAMIVTMAIHDTMKLSPLVPIVHKKVCDDFSGYAAGEAIGDHDIALSYVLQHFSDLLPSFRGLPEAQKKAIVFSLGKIEFNIGQLVQGEAPPGALLRAFREVSLAGGANPSDVSFYFVHWFVDLAGNDPTPLNGAEKFVLKFPVKVLGQFLDAFGIVHDIVKKTESASMEDYMVATWNQNSDLGDIPAGHGSIAKLRIHLMAQKNPVAMLDAFDRLVYEDQEVLSQEMAITGCSGQQYKRDSLAGFEGFDKGPSVLVYYGPALLQGVGMKDPRKALVILAEVYRKTRKFWPLTQKDVDKSVTVRIDALKDWTDDLDTKTYAIKKTSGKDALVTKLGTSEISTLDFTVNQLLNIR